QFYTQNSKKFTNPLYFIKSSKSRKLRNKYHKTFHKLNEFKQLFIRDFIDYWYKISITTNIKFYHSLNKFFDGLFNVFINSIINIDCPQFIQSFVIQLQEWLIRYKIIWNELSQKIPNFDKLSEMEQLILKIIKYFIYKLYFVYCR